MRPLRSLMLTIAAIAFLVVVTYLTEIFVLTRGREWSFRFAADQLPHAKVVLLIVATLLGIVASYLCQCLAALKEDQVPLWPLLKKMPRSRRFIMAICVTPTAFGVILTAPIDAPTIVHCIFAFQNGFFWETFLPGVAPRPSPE